MATPNLSFQNKFVTTLSSGVASTDTTISLTALPTPTEGYLVLEPDSSTAWEEIYYTSKTGSAVVCPSALLGRGIGGSTAASHSSGATVRMDSTAEMFKALQNGSALAAGAVGAQNLSNPYKFSVYRNGAWTQSNGTQVVTFDTKDYDTSSNVDIVTHVGRFTATVAGFYHFDATISIGNNATGTTYYPSLFKNSSEAKRGAMALTGGSSGTVAGTVSDTLQLAINDFVEVNSTWSGSNVSGVTGSALTHFSGFMVSAT